MLCLKRDHNSVSFSSEYSQFSCCFQFVFLLPVAAANALYLGPEPDPEHVPPNMDHVPIYRSFKNDENLVLKPEKEKKEEKEVENHKENHEENEVIEARPVSFHDGGETVFRSKCLSNKLVSCRVLTT